MKKTLKILIITTVLISICTVVCLADKVTLTDIKGFYDGDKVIEYTSESDVELPTPNRNGYVFDGWFANQSCTDGPYYVISSTDAGDREFWAKWSNKTYTIKLNTDGGNVSETNYSFTYESSTDIELPIPTKENYDFMGWYIGDEQVTTITNTNVESYTSTNIDIKAKWQQFFNGTYYLAYSSDKFESFMDNVSVTNIRITKDITTDKSFEINRDLKIDLNGKTITSLCEGSFLVVSGSDLTIDDLYGNGNLGSIVDGRTEPRSNTDYDVNGGFANISNGGKIFMYSGNIKNFHVNGYGGAFYVGPTIEDGNNKGTLTIYNGSIIGCSATKAGGAISFGNGNGTVNVSQEATFANNSSPNGGFIYIHSNNCFNMTGRATFESNTDNWKINSGGNESITNGIFICHTLTELGNIIEKTSGDYTIKLGSDITIPEDYEQQYGFVLEKGIKVDLNGKTIDVKRNNFSLFRIFTEGKLTLSGNGTIKSSYTLQSDTDVKNVRLAIVDGGSLEINGGTYANFASDNGGCIKVNSGDITINEGTFKENSATDFGGCIALNGGTLEVCGGLFEGNISEKYCGCIGANSPGVVNIYGGEFKNNTAKHGDAGAVNINSSSSSAIYGGYFHDNHTQGVYDASTNFSIDNIRVSSENQIKGGLFDNLPDNGDNAPTGKGYFLPAENYKNVYRELTGTDDKTYYLFGEGILLSETNLVGGNFTFDISKEPYNSILNIAEGYALKENSYAQEVPYAILKTNERFVLFETNGGTINSGLITKYATGTDTDLPTDVTKSGYNFLGWYRYPDFSSEQMTKILSNIDSDLILFARWEYIQPYVPDYGDDSGDDEYVPPYSQAKQETPEVPAITETPIVEDPVQEGPMTVEQAIEAMPETVMEAVSPEITEMMTEVPAEAMEQIATTVGATANFLGEQLSLGAISQEQYESYVEAVGAATESAVEIAASQEEAVSQAATVAESMPKNTGIDLSNSVSGFYERQMNEILGISQTANKTGIRRLSDVQSNNSGMVDLSVSADTYKKAVEFVNSSVEKMQNAALAIRECSGEKLKQNVSQYIDMICYSSFRDYDKEKADNEFVEQAYNSTMLALQQQVLASLDAEYENAKLNNGYGTTASTTLEEKYLKEREDVSDLEIFESMVMAVMMDRYIGLTGNTEIELVDFYDIYYSIFRSWALNTDNEYGMTLKELTTATINEVVDSGSKINIRTVLTTSETMFFASFALAIVSLYLLKIKSRKAGEC